MRSSKSRSRNKSNRQRTLGNVVNRVFDSSGPEGKVRGTPQQIIDKYLTLARDAQLSNDRVAEQSFLQHAEHYTRMLGEAQREMAERQQHQPHHQGQRQNGDDDRDGGNGNGRDYQPRDHQQQGRDATDRDQQGRDQQGSRDQGRDRNAARETAEPMPFAADHQEDQPQTPAQPQSEPEQNPRRTSRPRRDAAAQSAPAAAPRADEDQPRLGLPDALSSDGEDGPVETPESEGQKKPRVARPRTPRSATGRTRRKATDEAATDAPASNPVENGADQG